MIEPNLNRKLNVNQWFVFPFAIQLILQIAFAKVRGYVLSEFDGNDIIAVLKLLFQSGINDV